ncbi:MAG: lipase family alpha/beta hydrolase [Pseudomonadales bacterium]
MTQICRALRGFIALGLLLWLNACGLLGLGEELQKLNQDIMIGGQVTGELRAGAPIYVVVQDQRAGDTLHSYTSVKAGAPEQSYFFMLPPGEYRILAFQDNDGDLRRSKGEPVGEVLDGNPLQLSDVSQEQYELNIVLRRQAPRPLLLDLSTASLAKRRPNTPASLGAIVSLDDPSFSDEAAELGLWQPRQFMDQVVGGLFFLERYRSSKKPVLFIHGALGHPGNWRGAIKSLDRNHYQPWLYYYPTAASLEDVSVYLAWFIYELQAQLGFERLTLVAHSMGGLVALRAAQLLEEYQGNTSPIDRLITLSTPWQGHKGAAMGARLAPAAAPSWLDVSPGSDFLRDLAQRGLPAGVRHMLLFSYRGSSSLGDKADGAVSLTSQLAPEYQIGAERVIGFDETHRTILSGDRPLQTLQMLLR